VRWIRWQVLIPCVACAAAVGCGSAGTASAPPKVTVTLTAPTDGATVEVSKIEVLGTITPESAVVRVSGKPVHVKQGAFEEPLVLRKGVTHIRIDASAKGFSSASMVVSVRYAPRAPAPAAGSEGGGASSQPQSFASSGGGGEAPGDISPVQKAEAVNSCVNASEGNTTLCLCIFDRLDKAGFKTQAQWQALVENWRRSFLANGVITYPPVIKNAIVGCVKQLTGQ
jgi:glucodextranase-like protein